MSDVAKAVTVVALGALEGYAFARVGLLNPIAMEQQMGFKSFMVLKLFVSAMGTSMLAQSAMSVVAPEKFDKSRYYRGISFGLGRAVGGCLVLGAGMALAGSGATLVPSQIGVGVKSAGAIFAGMLVGGLAFGLAEPRMFGNDVCPLAKPGEKTSVDQIVGKSYAAISAPLGLALVGAIVGLEKLWPHSRDAKAAGGGSWLPIIAGAVIGLNQIPLRLIANHGQGGSTSIMTMLATVSGGAISGRHRLRDLKGATQLSYVWIGTLLGAYIGAKHEGMRPIEGFSTLRSVIGGALMMFGARFAGGCGCGRGISATSELSVESFAAACAIFGGGIATTFALKALGLTSA